MIKATSPAAKSSPMQTEAISARDTSTSALMSKEVTRPITASRMIGIPHSRMAIHAGSNGKGTRSKILNSNAIPDSTSSMISFLVPPSSRKSSSFSVHFIYLRLLYPYMYRFIIHMGV